jgi:hypothetical protein
VRAALATCLALVDHDRHRVSVCACHPSVTQRVVSSILGEVCHFARVRGSPAQAGAADDRGGAGATSPRPARCRARMRADDGQPRPESAVADKDAIF